MDYVTSQTRTNLARAFAGECQAGARYQFLAEMAEKAKQKEMSKVLKEIATNEMAHAKIFWNLITKFEKETCFHVPIEAGFPFCGADLPQALNFASEVEFSEHNNIYPSFARIAKDEGFPEVEKAFLDIAKIENCHHMLTKELSDKLKSGKLLKSKEQIKWKCAKCGYEAMGKAAWDICPVCGYDSGYVKIPLSDNP